MGHFSLTCSVSGLSISGGTPVRCVLLTASPYQNDDPRAVWLVRTPPIRAVYDDYGRIKDVHKDDLFTAKLWLRGLREDLVEKGLGDNSYHDPATTKEMTFEELIEAVCNGSRVEVRQDAKYFWGRPHAPLIPFGDTGMEDEYQPFFKLVGRALSKFAVSNNTEPGKYVVDEPIPNVGRVRFGKYEQDLAAHLKALEEARAAVEQAGFVGIVSAGSGRYPDGADLIVLPAPPNPKDGDRYSEKNRSIRGPQWDMAKGASADDDKKLSVTLAMVREDVWQALVNYPHQTLITLDCLNCNQESWYHEKGGQCPNKQVHQNPLKAHKKGSVYEHGPVFPKGVEHVVVKDGEYGREHVWYGVNAFKAGTRETWKKIQDYFVKQAKREEAVEEDEEDEEMPAPKKSRRSKAVAKDDVLDKLMETLEERRNERAKKIAALSPEERAEVEAKDRAATEAYENEKRERLENPVFGDFRIDDMTNVFDRDVQGAWIFRRATPGVIGISEHFSMCLADKLEVPQHVVDSLAELESVQRTMRGVGVIWKPALSTGTQDPEWTEYERFARTLGQLATNAHAKYGEKLVPLPVTIAEATLQFGPKAKAKKTKAKKIKTRAKAK